MGGKTHRTPSWPVSKEARTPAVSVNPKKKDITNIDPDVSPRTYRYRGWGKSVHLFPDVFDGLRSIIIQLRRLIQYQGWPNLSAKRIFGGPAEKLTNTIKKCHTCCVTPSLSLSLVDTRWVFFFTSYQCRIKFRQLPARGAARCCLKVPGNHTDLLIFGRTWSRRTTVCKRLTMTLFFDHDGLKSWMLGSTPMWGTGLWSMSLLFIIYSPKDLHISASANEHSLILL